jgi:hypothetical protein
VDQQENPTDYGLFVEKLAALSNHFERAMVTFLDHSEFWNGASHFHHADTLAYWRKRKNLSKASAHVDGASLRQLAILMSTYFHQADGRGKHCTVEALRRGELDYFFAYPEDYSKDSIEWVDGELGPRPHNPAFEVVYIYSQKDGSLDLNFRGPRNSVEPLQGIFATAILKQPQLPPDPKDERVYDLSALGSRSFQFLPAIGSGIQDVVVKSLRFSSKLKRGDRITLEADPSDAPGSLYDLKDKVGQSVPLTAYHITHVALAATVIADAASRPKVITIRIAHPNSCSLRYDDIDLKLRAMLAASGIEPKAESSVPGAI